MPSPGRVLDGLWRFEALHPDWTEDEGGDEGWEPSVAWWAVACPDGLVLIDPLIANWDELDRLVEAHGGVAGIIRTCHWHQRSVEEAAARYAAQVWARPAPEGTVQRPYDRAVSDRDSVFDHVRVADVERADEIALWLGEQRALVFGDAMLRRPSGELRVCPDSWLQPAGSSGRLREILRRVAELPVEHVLVSHGPLVLGDAPDALASALAR
jgi:glyoxylase-like metal-dependent hydrolase (beta-lactamase superfamily II)